MGGGVSMKDMIERIVNMDEKSRLAVQKLQQDKINSEQELLFQKEKIKNEYLTRARERIESNKIIEQKNAEEKLKKILEEQMEISKRLDKIYEEEGNSIIEKIVCRVLGE